MNANNLVQIPIQHPTQKGVDQRKTYGMDSFELSVLETFENATVTQSFPEPIFYNLLRGKKVMKFQNEQPFDYLPGSTMIVPARLQMEVNFPDTTLINPTQCLSLTIDRMKIASSLSLLNERYPRLDGKLWHLSMQHYSMIDNDEISKLIFKLYNLAHLNTQEARIIAELTLTELLVLLFQNQNLAELKSSDMTTNGVLNDIVRFIQDNIDMELSVELLAQKAAMSKTTLFRTFKREFNISPIDFVNKTRIEKAKSLMENIPNLSISEISYSVGFNNPNYFSKIFKQYIQQSPTDFRKETNLQN